MKGPDEEEEDSSALLTSGTLCNIIRIHRSGTAYRVFLLRVAAGLFIVTLWSMVQKKPSGSTNSPFNNTVAEELQIPHGVVYIGSVLCMTVRFPFEVPEQDPNVHYVSPFEPKFYTIEREDGLVFIDEEVLRACEMQTRDMEIDEAVKYCIEDVATANENKKVVAMWTRQRYDGTTSFHSTGLPENVNTVYDYFGEDPLALIMVNYLTYKTDDWLCNSNWMFRAECDRS